MFMLIKHNYTCSLNSRIVEEYKSWGEIQRMLFSHAKFGRSHSPFLNQQSAPYDSPYSRHLFIGSSIIDMESGLHSRSQARQAVALRVCGAFVRGVRDFPAHGCRREGHGTVSAWTDGLASCVRAVCEVCTPGIQKSPQFSDAEKGYDLAPLLPLCCDDWW